MSQKSCSHCKHRTPEIAVRDRKSTRLNSSHSQISYAVFCLKKKKTSEIVAVDPRRDRPRAEKRPSAHATAGVSRGHAASAPASADQPRLPVKRALAPTCHT